MKVYNEALAHSIKFKAKPGALPVAGIRPDPAIPKPVLPGTGNDFKGKLLFGAKDPFIPRNTRFFTTLRVIGPLLWKIKFDINRDCKAVLGKHAEHRHLPVVNLAQSAQPLPGHTGRHRPLLWKPLSSSKTGSLFVTQTRIGITGNVIDDTAGIPPAVGQKLLEIAGLGIRDDFGHPVHVFTRTGLHQTAGILPRPFRNIVAVGAEMVAEALYKGHKAPADAGERRLWGDMRFSPLVMVLSAGCVS